MAIVRDIPSAHFDAAQHSPTREEHPRGASRRAPDPRQSTPGPHLHRTAFGAVQVWWWDSAHAHRAVRQFTWLGAGSVKVALSRPAHQPRSGRTPSGTAVREDGVRDG